MVNGGRYQLRWHHTLLADHFGDSTIFVELKFRAILQHHIITPINKARLDSGKHHLLTIEVLGKNGLRNLRQIFHLNRLVIIRMKRCKIGCQAANGNHQRLNCNFLHLLCFNS